MQTFDAIVAGAGIWGCTVARRLAEAGKRVLVLEKRAAVGGNCRCEIDPETGIEVHTYGSHIFHTSNEEVWKFVRRFTEFNDYRHVVLARTKKCGREGQRSEVEGQRSEVRGQTAEGDFHTYHLPIGKTLLEEFFGVSMADRNLKEFLAEPIMTEGQRSEVRGQTEEGDFQRGRGVLAASSEDENTTRRWCAEMKVAEWLAGVDDAAFEAALVKLVEEKTAAGEYRFKKPEERELALEGARKFYREFSRKIVSLSDGRYVYFAPDERAKVRNASNAVSWAEYAFHAVSNGGAKVPGKNYNERWYNPHKQPAFALIEGVLKQEKCFIRLSAADARFHAIVFAGTEDAFSRLQVVTRLDDAGNIDANLSEVTFTASRKEKKSPRLVPLTEAVRTVVHYQIATGSYPPNANSIANAGDECKGGGEGQRSEVRGQRSEVEGQRSEVEGQRSEVRGQRSEVEGQRSEVRGQTAEVDLQRGRGVLAASSEEENTTVQPSTSNLQPETPRTYGDAVFDAFIRGYTSKQWGVAPEKVDPSIIARLKVRDNYSTDYFDDPHQGIPSEGYNRMFEKMLDHPNITVETEMTVKVVGADLRAARNPGSTQPALEIDCGRAGRSPLPVYYSGPIDALFNYKFGALPWRTLRFERETLPVADYQGNSVVNYTDADVPFTRIHEFRHYHPEWMGSEGQRSEVEGQRSEVEGQRSEVEGQRSEVEGQRSKVRGQTAEGDFERGRGVLAASSEDETTAVQPLTSNLQPSTIIMREYSATWRPGDEPYYPINTPESAALLAKYQAEVDRLNSSLFTFHSSLTIGGRLGQYKYYDMDKSIASALAVQL